MHEMNIGQLVLSKAGRDKGNYFLVMEMSGEYLYLADGKHRRMDQLKKKKKKHVQPTHWMSQMVAEGIQSYEKFSNVEIQKEIQRLLEKSSGKEE